MQKAFKKCLIIIFLLTNELFLCSLKTKTIPYNPLQSFTLLMSADILAISRLITCFSDKRWYFFDIHSDVHQFVKHNEFEEPNLLIDWSLDWNEGSLSFLYVYIFGQLINCEPHSFCCKRPKNWVRRVRSPAETDLFLTTLFSTKKNINHPEANCGHPTTTIYY